MLYTTDIQPVPRQVRWKLEGRGPGRKERGRERRWEGGGEVEDGRRTGGSVLLNGSRLTCHPALMFAPVIMSVSLAMTFERLRNESSPTRSITRWPTLTWSVREEEGVGV